MFHSNVYNWVRFRPRGRLSDPRDYCIIVEFQLSPWPIVLQSTGPDQPFSPWCVLVQNAVSWLQTSIVPAIEALSVC